MSKKTKNIVSIVIAAIVYAIINVTFQENGVYLGAIPAVIIWLGLQWILGKIFGTDD